MANCILLISTQRRNLQSFIARLESYTTRMNSYSGPSPKRAKYLHSSQEMPVFHANGSSMFTNGGIPQGQTLYFPTTVIPSQFIDATDTNQLVPSTPYGNAHFAPQNAPFYSSLDLSFARCYSTTPVGACFHVFPCSAHGWLDYSFTGMSSSAVSQQFSSFPLPAISNRNSPSSCSRLFSLKLFQIPTMARTCCRFLSERKLLQL